MDIIEIKNLSRNFKVAKREGSFLKYMFLENIISLKQLKILLLASSRVNLSDLSDLMVQGNQRP